MYVVLGGGQAGYWAARTLREVGYTGPLTLFGDETYPPYERPPLSKGVLRGDLDAATAILADPAKLAELGVDWRGATRAHAIDRTNRVISGDGWRLGYERLLLATGANSRSLRVPGANASGVFYLRTMDEALNLRKALLLATEVVVVGAGWIGLEVAAAARSLGCAVTVVEGSSRPCARVLPLSISGRVQTEHETRGVQFLFDRVVAEIVETAGWAVGVRLDDGRVLNADVIVVGVGASPNDELAVQAGLDVQDGVLVDPYGRTSDPNIFAAGDVARYPSVRTGGSVRCESWAQAQDQAIVAARSMAGSYTEPFDPAPWFWSDQYDQNIQIVGQTGDPFRLISVGGEPDGLLIWIDGQDQLRGAAGLNAGGAIRLIRRAIERAVRIEPKHWTAAGADPRRLLAQRLPASREG